MKHYNIVVMGMGGVGKTALVTHYNTVRSEGYHPSEEDSILVQKEVDGEMCRMEILDTKPSSEFTAMRDLYLRNGDVFVLVYAVSSMASFTGLDDLYEQIVAARGNGTIVPIVLVANSLDGQAEEEVEIAVAEEKAESWNCPLIGVASGSPEAADLVFGAAVRHVNAIAPKKDTSNDPKSKCVIS